MGKRGAVRSNRGPVVLLLGAAALASVPACSKIGEGSGGGDADAGADAGGPGLPDATAELGPFSAPRLIEPLSDPEANDDDPSVTGDLLELYFNSNRSGNSNLWVSRRNSVDQPWGDPDPVVGTGINTSNNETAPEISTDGLRLYFSSNRDGGLGSQDIYVTTRADRDAPWEMPDRVPELNSSAGDYSPVEDETGKVIYFYSSRDGGDQDLFFSTRDSVDDPWREPMPIDELNSEDNDADPFPTGDGRTLYFGSGPANLLDLHVARRAAAQGEFGPGEPIDELNSDAHETDPWVSPAGRYIVFISNQSGANEIYEADR